MYYQKKLFAIVLLFSGLILLGCNKDKESDALTKLDLEKISKLPYSQLDPDEQKIKLESESLEFLKLCKAAQSSVAVEAFQHLNDLLDVEMVVYGSGISAMKVKSVKAAVEYADYYGVYTWNASKKDWDYAPSKDELKFVFPARKGSKNNNAELSIKVASSSVLVDDLFYMPKSVTCTLTVSNKEEAKIEFSADYKNNHPVPVKTEFKFTTGDGYSCWWKIEKGNESQIAMKMTYKNQIMFEVLFKSGIKLDEIFDLAFNNELEDQYHLLDEVNGYVKLMDDLVLVYAVDIANYIQVSEKVEADYEKKMSQLHPDWANYNNWQTVQEAWSKNGNRYISWGQYEKNRSDENAKAFNDHAKVTLFSTKENYKIADMVQHSIIDDDYWDYYKWDANQNKWTLGDMETKKFDYYANIPFLKFGDQTEVEASVYFSEGFDQLEKQLEDFFKSFDR